MKYFGLRAWLTRHKGFLCLLLLLKVVENLWPWLGLSLCLALTILMSLGRLL